MNPDTKVFFYLLSFNLLLPVSTDWIAWGQCNPQAIGLGVLAYIGMVVSLSAFAHVLEQIPRLLVIRH
jgi:hypothetical protein